MPEDITVETAINEKLKGLPRDNAMALIAFLREHEITLTSNNDGTGWAVGGIVGDSLGFLFISGEADFPGPWTLWFNTCDFQGELSDAVKETARAHASPCGRCHKGWQDCGGGERTIFGQTFERLCHSPLMFTNPDAETIEHVKQLLLSA